MPQPQIKFHHNNIAPNHLNNHVDRRTDGRFPLAELITTSGINHVDWANGPPCCFINKLFYQQPDDERKKTSL